MKNTLFLLFAAASIISGPLLAQCPVAAGHAVTKKKGYEPLSVDTMENCDSLRFAVIGYIGEQLFQQAYDSSMKFIETCYSDPNSPLMFQNFSAARQVLEESDTSLWLTAQLWLESVLYLNTTNPEYFCACVEAMQVGDPNDTGYEQGQINLNKGLAIDEWLVQNTTCDTPTVQNGIYGARASQYESWLNDTTVPLDTTLPPLSSLDGLDTILAKHFLYVNSVSQQVGILSNASAYPNPTGSGTVISFGIAQEAYVKIEVFDVLGNLVSSAGFESLFEPGNKAVPISLAGLPAGTYFARIETAYGEAQTVKVVKQ